MNHAAKHFVMALAAFAKVTCWQELIIKFINQKAVSPVDNKKYYIHDSLRRTYIHKRQFENTQRVIF